MTQQVFQPPRGLDEFEEDARWFYENLEKLKKFSGKFVAIKSKKVIASDKNVNDVIKEVEEQGENPSYLLIEFVYSEGTVVLL